MLTLNQIVKQLNNIADSHANINNFFFGELYDFATSGTTEYPCLAVTLEPLPYQSPVMTYSFNIYMMDLVKKDISNRQEVLSDMLLNCFDLVSLLTMKNDFVFSVEKNVTFNDFVDRFDQEVSGYWFNLRIKTPFVLDQCAVPLIKPIEIVNQLLPTEEVVLPDNTKYFEEEIVYLFED
jgi:hypothetical protein